MNAAAPTEPGPDASLAVLTVEVRYIKAAVERIEQGNAGHVTRNEWEQRNGFVDSRFVGLDKELAARRVPWTSVGALVIAGAVLVIDIIQRIN